MGMTKRQAVVWGRIFWYTATGSGCTRQELYDGLSGEYGRSAIAGTVKRLIQMGFVDEKMTDWPRTLVSQKEAEVMGAVKVVHNNYAPECGFLTPNCGFLTPKHGEDWYEEALYLAKKPENNENALSFGSEIDELLQISRECGFFKPAFVYSLSSLKSLANSHKIHIPQRFILRIREILIQEDIPKLRNRAPVWIFVNLLEERYFANNSLKPWEPSSTGKVVPLFGDEDTPKQPTKTKATPPKKGSAPLEVNDWFNEHTYRLLTLKAGTIDRRDYKRQLVIEGLANESFYAGYYKQWGLDPYLRTLHGWCAAYVQIMGRYFKGIPVKGPNTVLGKRPTASKYWPKIIEARRIADQWGATYEDWIEAIAAHYRNEPLRGMNIPHPGFFNTQRAGEIVTQFLAGKYHGRCRDLEVVIFEPHEHNINDPIQARHYYGIIDSLQYVSWMTKESPHEIILKAVKRGIMPLDYLQRHEPLLYTYCKQRLDNTPRGVVRPACV